MRIHSLRMRNFLSHRDTEVIFPERGLLLIAGENGSGKSSLLDGIVFALSGVAPPRATSISTVKNLLHFGQNTLSTTLILESNNTFYRIDRVYNADLASGKTTVVAYKGGRKAVDTGEGWELIPLPRGRSKQWQELTEILWDIPSSALMMGPIIPQDRASDLVEAPPSILRSMFMDLFWGKSYEELIKHLKAMQKETSVRLAEIRAKMAGTQMNILPEDLRESHISELKKIERDLQNVRNILDNARQAYTWLADVQKLAGDMTPKEYLESITYGSNLYTRWLENRRKAQKVINGLRTELEIMRQTYKRKLDAFSKLPDIQKKIESVEIEIAEKQEKVALLASLQAEMESISHAISLAKGEITVCPVCGTPVSPKDIRKHLENNILPRKNEIEIQIRDIRRAERDFKALSARREELLKMSGRKTALSEELEKLKINGIKKRKYLQKTIQENRRQRRAILLNGSGCDVESIIRFSREDEGQEGLCPCESILSIKNYRKLIRLAKKHKVSPDAIIETIARYQEQEWDEISQGKYNLAEINALREKKIQLEERIAHIRVKLEEDERARKILETLEHQVSGIEVQSKAQEWIATMLDKNSGIPKIILQEMLGEIADYATQYARAMCPNLERVIFEDANDQLSIWITRSGGMNVSVNSLSKGERTKIGLATRLAVSSVAASQRDIDFVLGDETLGSLDEQSRTAFIRVLQDQSKEKQIILVSHVPVPADATKEIFVWRVKKEHGSSIVDTSPDNETIKNILLQKTK